MAAETYKRLQLDFEDAAKKLAEVDLQSDKFGEKFIGAFNIWKLSDVAKDYPKQWAVLEKACRNVEDAKKKFKNHSASLMDFSALDAQKWVSDGVPALLEQCADNLIKSTKAIIRNLFTKSTIKEIQNAAKALQALAKKILLKSGEIEENDSKTEAFKKALGTAEKLVDKFSKEKYLTFENVAQIMQSLLNALTIWRKFKKHPGRSDSEPFLKPLEDKFKKILDECNRPNKKNAADTIKNSIREFHDIFCYMKKKLEVSKISGRAVLADTDVWNKFKNIEYSVDRMSFITVLLLDLTKLVEKIKKIDFKVKNEKTIQEVLEKLRKQFSNFKKALDETSEKRVVEMFEKISNESEEIFKKLTPGNRFNTNDMLDIYNRWHEFVDFFGHYVTSDSDLYKEVERLETEFFEVFDWIEGKNNPQKERSRQASASKVTGGSSNLAVTNFFSKNLSQKITISNFRKLINAILKNPSFKIGSNIYSLSPDFITNWEKLPSDRERVEILIEELKKLIDNLKKDGNPDHKVLQEAYKRLLNFKKSLPTTPPNKPLPPTPSRRPLSPAPKPAGFQKKEDNNITLSFNQISRVYIFTLNPNMSTDNKLFIKNWYSKYGHLLHEKAPKQATKLKECWFTKDHKSLKCARKFFTSHSARFSVLNNSRAPFNFNTGNFRNV